MLISMKRSNYISLSLIAAASLFLSSCHYKPFLAYTLNSEGFKNFTKKERAAGDNSDPARDYKLNRYDWSVEVFPDKKRIAGEMDIYFTTRSEQMVFLFDLQKRMKIVSFSCSAGDAEIDRKQDLLYLKFKQALSPNTRIKLSISYRGKPASLLSEGPMQWKVDKKERVWISSVTEGIGPQFIMPCNALLRAEADSTNINVTVPEDLVAVSNGHLVEVISNTEAGTKTFRHEITNPINIYSISLNAGHFVKFTKPYLDINGVERELTYQVLDYNLDTAKKFYEQTEIILKELETLYGEFPFWEDGCKIVESTFSAMEHQSAIAMGSNYRNSFKDFNSTLIHELSHEWWGNSVTGMDYCDIWIHEGMATYSEALVLERIYGPEAYDLKMKRSTRIVSNTIPILKECDVLYNSWVNSADQDIYHKGALMMHSLRKVVDNDSLFFRTLFLIQQKYSKQNITTAKIVSEFNKLLGADYNALFDWYLKKLKPPVLQVYVDKEQSEIFYKWKSAPPFYKSGQVFLKQEDEVFNLIPTEKFQSQKVEEGLRAYFQIERSIYYSLELLESMP